MTGSLKLSCAYLVTLSSIPVANKTPSRPNHFHLQVSSIPGQPIAVLCMGVDVGERVGIDCHSAWSACSLGRIGSGVGQRIDMSPVVLVSTPHMTNEPEKVGTGEASGRIYKPLCPWVP